MLDWQELYDDFDNTYYEADSPFHDDGSHFKFRLRPRLENDRIEWFADHDDELGGDGEFWLTLEEAKAACEEARAVIITECAEEDNDD